MKVYLELDDNYDLPIRVADTIKELSEMIGCTPNSISSAMSHSRKRNSKCKYIEVEIEEKEN